MCRNSGYIANNRARGGTRVTHRYMYIAEIDYEQTSGKPYTEMAEWLVTRAFEDDLGFVMHFNARQFGSRIDLLAH